MSQWKKSILFSYPEVIAGVILMVMRIDNDLGMQGIEDFHKSISTKGGARIDQEPINKKGINLE
jgi:hypothetical protein